MPRARSPDSIKAEQMYHDGKLLKDIAEELGVPAGTVRRWKSTQKWDADKDERSPKKKPAKKASKKTNARKKKRGAPKGNKNAVGNKSSAPRNQKAVKHGAYRAVFFNFLGDEDKELLENMTDFDTEDRLIMEIQVLTIRERRVMAAIEEKKKDPLYISSINQIRKERVFAKGEEGEKEKQEYKRLKEIAVAAGVALPGEEVEKDTRTEATIDLIARLDRELTSIQKQISADLKQLEDLRTAREAATHREKKRQLELELLDARIEQVDAQTNKLLGTDLEIEDMSEIDALIYGGEDDADNAQDSPVSADAEGSEASEDD